ncbi:MAG: DUF5828 family protein [Halobacteriota archaeon]
MSRQRDRDDKEVERDTFGYTVEGDWQDVVDFGEDVVSTFEEHDVDEETISEWDSWRPRSGEEAHNMRKKTVESAKVQEGEDPDEMADETAERLTRTGEKTREGDIGEAAESMGEAGRSASKAVGGVLRRLMRGIEERVYDRIARTNPLYFDASEFNASLEPIEGVVSKLPGREANGDEAEYRMSIKPESDEVERALDDEFESEAERETTDDG